MFKTTEENIIIIIIILKHTRIFHFSKRDDRPGSGRDRLQGNGRRPGRMEEGGRPPIQLDAREGKELFAHIQGTFNIQTEIYFSPVRVYVGPGGVVSQIIIIYY